MQPPWRLPGIEGGGTPPHQREWSGQGAALSWPREYAGESHTNAQGLYKWALPCFLRRLLCSKILPSIEALSHFPAQLPRKFQSRNPDAPQTATGRRRAALTALGGPDAPQTATGRPILSKIPTSRPGPGLGGGGTPSETPFFLSNPSRACARPRVRARIMRPRARFWPLD